MTTNPMSRIVAPHMGVLQNDTGESWVAGGYSPRFAYPLTPPFIVKEAILSNTAALGAHLVPISAILNAEESEAELHHPQWLLPIPYQHSTPAIFIQCPAGLQSELARGLCRRMQHNPAGVIQGNSWLAHYRPPLHASRLLASNVTPLIITGIRHDHDQPIRMLLTYPRLAPLFVLTDPMQYLPIPHGCIVIQPDNPCLQSFLNDETHNPWGLLKWWALREYERIQFDRETRYPWNVEGLFDFPISGA